MRPAVTLMSGGQDGKPVGRSRLQRLVAALMLPREHGAWAMLLMPFLIGAAAAGWGGWESLLLLASILLLFSSSRPLEVLTETRRVASARRESAATADNDNGAGAGLRPAPARPAPTRHSTSPEILRRRGQAAQRLVGYVGLGSATAVYLLLASQRWLLLAIGVPALLALGSSLALRRFRLDRTWPARLLSIAALSATGPAAYYTISGVLDRRAAAVWLLATLYSCASVFYVRMFHHPPVRRKPTPEFDLQGHARRQLLAYLSVAATLLVTLSALGWTPPLGVLAFVPLAAKLLWASTRRDYHPSLKQLGFAEIGHAVLFALLAVAAMVTWT